MPGKELTIEEFKIACIVQDHELSDEEVWQLLQKVTLENHDEIEELCGILRKYRPKVAKRLRANLSP
jgi:hypothetical protein